MPLPPPSLCRPLARGGFLALLLAIAWLALTPKPPAQADLGWDKANHLAAFAVLHLSGAAAWPAAGAGRLALGLMAYGAGIELAQSQLPPREGDAQDLLADALGLGVGQLALSAWRRRPRRHQRG